MSIRVIVLVRTTAVFSEVTPVALFVHQPTDLNVFVPTLVTHLSSLLNVTQKQLPAARLLNQDIFIITVL